MCAYLLIPQHKSACTSSQTNYHVLFLMTAAQARYSSVLPLLILGLCSIVGAAATFFLPETAGRTLPQTLEDGSQFGRDQSRWEYKI